MRMACIWFLTGGMLLPFCNTYAQGGDKDGAVENAPTMCNDGSISVYVAWNQLVSAPLGAPAAATPVDDPVGEGGFIKPASGRP
jgi:hypothetical protein